MLLRLLSPTFESATSTLEPTRSQTQLLSAICLGWEFRHLGGGGRREASVIKASGSTDTNRDPLEKSLSAPSNGGEEMGALTLGV